MSVLYLFASMPHQIRTDQGFRELVCNENRFHNDQLQHLQNSLMSGSCSSRMRRKKHHATKNDTEWVFFHVTLLEVCQHNRNILMQQKKH